jgi:hypothetical protein
VTTSRRSALVLSAGLLLAANAASAQGTLSTLGFGYPAGQISTRSQAAGGSIADFDPLSTTNPASVSAFGGSAAYVQADPEYRKLNVGAASESGMIARHALMSAGVPINSTLYGGLSLSNFLDRTVETSVRGQQRIGDSTLATTNVFKSDGAMADVRLSLAWIAKSWLRLGIAAHAITGDNRLSNTQRFDDSTRFGALLDTSTVTYVGSAVSGGVELFAGSVAGIAASYRKGGPLSAKYGDNTLSKAHVPDRLSFSAAFIGIKGTTIAARTAREKWTQMDGLGSNNLPIYDTYDTSIGADVAGPRIGARTIQIRGGVRWRTLPFGLPTSEIKERNLSLGLGTTLARGRVGLDLAGIHSLRDPVSSSVDVSERAWTMSVGVTVRP